MSEPAESDDREPTSADEGWREEQPEPERTPPSSAIGAAAEAGALSADVPGEPGASEGDADEQEASSEGRAAVRLRTEAQLEAAHRERVARCLDTLALADTERGHSHLAETALWLALANLELEFADELDAWLAGGAWEALGLGAVHDPRLQRVAMGLILQQAARSPGVPASARVAATLAAIALACADPETGARLQRGFASLELWPVTEQVPVALPARALALEFRHLSLREDVPADFVARCEDLIDRLDATGLLGVQLSEHPDLGKDPALAWWEALIGTRSPQLLSLARPLLTSPEPFEDLPSLRAALPAPRPGLEVLRGRYESLRARLENTPFALLDPAQGWGLAVARERPRG